MIYWLKARSLLGIGRFSLSLQHQSLITKVVQS
jgi:hypothetical protein